MSLKKLHITRWSSSEREKMNVIFCLQDNHRINGNLFTLCYRGRGNFSVRFYETLMRGRIPIQINSSSIFPYEDEIDPVTYCEPVKL